MHMALDLKSLQDEPLMLLYKEGNANAFAELLQRHQQHVFGYFFRFLGNQQQAEEATQEAFFHVLRAAKNYEPKAKFTTWMYRIVHNYAIDCYRRNKLRRTTSLDQPAYGEDSNETVGDLVEAPEESQESSIIDQDLHDRLQAALQQLNPDQREVFLMREDQGMAFHEIADVLTVSINTVKSRMRYAIATLRKILEKEFKQSHSPLTAGAKGQ